MFVPSAINVRNQENTSKNCNLLDFPFIIEIVEGICLSTTYNLFL